MKSVVALLVAASLVTACNEADVVDPESDNLDSESSDGHEDSDSDTEFTDPDSDECCTDAEQRADAWMRDAEEDGVTCSDDAQCPGGSCNEELGLCMCSNSTQCGGGLCTEDGVCGPVWCNGYYVCSCWGGSEWWYSFAPDTTPSDIAMEQGMYCCENEDYSSNPQGTVLSTGGYFSKTPCE